MKRKMSLICCLLALTVLSSIAFLACEKKPAGPTYTEPTAAELELVLEMIETDHKKAFSDATPANYELNTIYVLSPAAAYLQYTVAVDTTGGAKEDDVKVVNSAENNKCTVEVNSKSKIEVPYTLTVTLVNKKGEAYKKDDGSLYTVSFSHKIPAYTLVTFEEFVKAADDASEQTVTVVGYLTGIISTTSGSKGSIYLVDKQGYGYYAYGPTGVITDSITNDEQLRAAWPVGTEIEVSGTATCYNGQYEFNKGCSVTKTGNSITQEELYVYRNATADWSKAVDNQDTALIPYQNALVELNNAKMVSVSSDNKYYYFTVGGKKFNLYNTNYFMDGDDVKTLLEKFAVGKQATIKGLVSVYSKVYQIYPLGLDAISDVKDATFTDQEMIDSTISEVSVTAEYTENGEQALQVKGTAFENVTISWAIKGEAPASVTLVGNKLTVTLGSTTDTVTLIATFTCNGATETKEYTVKVIGAIDWKDVAFANTEAAKLDGTSKETSTETYYFYGTVGEITNESYCNFNLVDGDDSILVYGINNAEGKRYGTKDGHLGIPFKTGDRVFMSGKLQNYNGTLEIVQAVLLEAPEAGTSIVNPMTVEQAIEKCTALKKDNTDSEDKYYVIGTVGEIYNTKYCNFYLVNGENSITVYGLMNSEGVKFGTKDETYTAITFKIGDVVVIYANLQRFVKTSGETNTTTNELTNGTLISVTEAPAEPTDAEKLAAIIAKMSTEVTADFNLDETVTWTVTSGSAIVITNGKAVVTRPAAGEQDATVVLTATLGEATQTVTITVKAIPSTDNYETLTLAEFLAKADSNETFYKISGVVVNIKDTTFGNIYISDGTTVVYVYGLCANQMELTSGKFTNVKDFNTLGVEVGTYITIVSAKGSYNGTAQAVGSGLTDKRAATTEEMAYVYKYQAEETLGKITVTATVANNFVLDKSATWTSDNAAIVISTAEDGTVNATVTRGSEDVVVTLTATVNVSGQTATKTFTVTVQKSGEAALFTETVSIKDYATANSWANDTKYTTLKGTSFTATATGSPNTGKYYSKGNEWRIYQTETPSVKIEAKTGYMIVSVKITYNVKNTGVLTLNSKTIATGTVVDVNTTSITFNVGNTGTATNGQVKITAIEVVYVAA